MSALDITMETFESEVLKSESPVLVDFWAPWCGPCRVVSPLIEQVANEAEGVKVCKVNVDDCPEIAKNYGVMSIPTLIVFKGGNVHKTSVGAIPKAEILELLK